MSTQRVPPVSRAASESGKPTNHRGRPWLRRSAWLVVGILLAMASPASPASAHGAGETEEGFMLVQQALANLAYDPGHNGMDLAMEKVNDALATKDQEGVDVAQVKQAKAALEAEHVGPARVLLQKSITVAVSKLAPATGVEAGTTLVLTPLRGRGGLTGQDWGFGLASLLILLAGTALAFRFRPADNLRQLRRQLAGPAAASAAPGGAEDDTSEGNRS